MTPDPKAAPAATDEEIDLMRDDWERCMRLPGRARSVLTRFDQDREKIDTLEAEAKAAEENHRAMLEAVGAEATQQVDALTAERDEARAEADELKASRAYEREEAERILNAEIERFSKLLEERDAAEAVILEEYESWGSDCSDDLVVMAKEIQRRREEKGGE